LFRQVSEELTSFRMDIAVRLDNDGYLKKTDQMIESLVS